MIINFKNKKFINILSILIFITLYLIFYILLNSILIYYTYHIFFYCNFLIIIFITTLCLTILNIINWIIFIINFIKKKENLNLKYYKLIKKSKNIQLKETINIDNDQISFLNNNNNINNNNNNNSKKIEEIKLDSQDSSNSLRNSFCLFSICSSVACNRPWDYNKCLNMVQPTNNNDECNDSDNGGNGITDSFWKWWSGDKNRIVIGQELTAKYLAKNPRSKYHNKWYQAIVKKVTDDNSIYIQWKGENIGTWIHQFEFGKRIKVNKSKEPSHKKLKETDGLTGLRNLGNSCFLNSALQVKHLLNCINFLYIKNIYDV